jgi:hypothetical protein
MISPLALQLEFEFCVSFLLSDAVYLFADTPGCKISHFSF